MKAVDPGDPVSAKIRKADHEAGTKYAKNLGSNLMEVVSAMRFLFDSSEPRRRREALNRVRLRFPSRQPRMGRGNKLSA